MHEVNTMAIDNDESEDNDIEQIQKKRLTDLQKRLLDGQKRAQAESEIKTRKRLLIGKILTQDARERLERLRIVKPEFVEQLESQLIDAAQSGAVKLPVNDEQIKALLTKLESNKRGITIRRL